MTESRGVRQNVEAEAKRIEDDTLRTFKQLYEAGASERRRHYWVGSAAAMLSVIAGGSALANVPEWRMAVPAISLAVTMLTAWTTFVKPAERAQEYKNAACDFQQLRDDTRVFREIDLPRPNVDEELLVERIKVLSARRAELRKDSPQPPPWAYPRAKRAIERGEAEYNVDTCAPKR
jgi:hypothetical protein